MMPPPGRAPLRGVLSAVAQPNPTPHGGEGGRGQEDGKQGGREGEGGRGREGGRERAGGQEHDSHPCLADRMYVYVKRCPSVILVITAIRALSLGSGWRF
jgi:hypothetical protein